MRDSPDFIPTNPIKTPPPPPPHSARRLLRAALTTLALLAGLGAPETRAAISNVTAAQMPDIGNGALNVASFHIGKYEVTWGEWQTVRSWAAANGYDIGSVGAGSGNDHPVRDVNWYHVVKVGNGAAFPAVTVNPAAGWSFTGWTPVAPTAVMNDFVATAQYSPSSGSFERWLSEHSISGDPATLFRQHRAGDGLPYGHAYAFGSNLPTDGPAQKILVVNGRQVLEIPAQDAATLSYVGLRVLGSTNPSSTGACRSSRSQGPPPGACGINSTASRPISRSSKWRRC